VLQVRAGLDSTGQYIDPRDEPLPPEWDGFSAGPCAYARGVLPSPLLSGGTRLGGMVAEHLQPLESDEGAVDPPLGQRLTRRL
jgi:hypothetical protein